MPLFNSFGGGPFGMSQGMFPQFQMPQHQAQPGLPPSVQKLIDVFQRDQGGLRTAADFQESMRPGTAPPTAANIGAALSNAFNTISSPITTGIATAANQLTGLGELRKEDTFLGKVVDALTPGGFKTVNAKPYDADLIAGVNASTPAQMQQQKARASAEQSRRDAKREAEDKERRAESGRQARGV